MDHVSPTRPVKGALILALFSSAIASFVASASANTIFARSELFEGLADAPGYVTLDSETGQVTGLGLISGARDPSHYAFGHNIDNPTLYGFDSGNLVTFEPNGFLPGGSLTVPLTRLIGTVIGPVGVNRIGGLAFDPSSDRLFAVDDGNQLLRIDTATGAGTVIGPIGSAVLDLAFDPRIGQLVGLRHRTGFAPDVIAIDQETGASTRIAGLLFDGASGLAFDDAADRLIALVFTRSDGGVIRAGQLIDIESASGATVAIAAVDPDVYEIHNEFEVKFDPTITVIPDNFLVPEPSSLYLLLLALTSLQPRSTRY